MHRLDMLEDLMTRIKDRRGLTHVYGKSILKKGWLKMVTKEGKTKFDFLHHFVPLELDLIVIASADLNAQH